jgi:hypothetical protein
MARPRKMQRLNDAKSEVIAENLLKENPEGLPPIQAYDPEKIVIAKSIPKMKKFVFLNNRDPGVALCFHYASATHPLKNYTLYHGLEHELPEEVIDHLESCNEPQYSYRKGVDGHPESFIESRRYIFQCRSAPRRAA